MLAPDVQRFSALENSSKQTPQYEVIVTDDGGSATAESLVKESFPWVQWIRGPGEGPAANRNHGAAQAKGNWLAFLDDDCLPSENWLESYCRVFDAMPDAVVLEGRTSAPRQRERLLEIAPINEHGGSLWACNFAIKRDFFESLRGFDTRFPYASMEDCDFHQRVKQQIGAVPFVRDALVVHPWRALEGVRTFLVQRYSELIYANIHPEAVYLRSLWHWLRFYLRAAVRETPKDWWRYPREMLEIQPTYVRLQLMHLWALATHQGPEFYRRRLTRLDQSL